MKPSVQAGNINWSNCGAKKIHLVLYNACVLHLIVLLLLIFCEENLNL